MGWSMNSVQGFPFFSGKKMTGDTLVYELDPAVRHADIMRSLADSGFVSMGIARRRELFLDSFDWRCWNAKAGLVEVAMPGQRWLEWIDAATGICRALAPVKKTPRFSEDMSAGPLRDRLAPALDMRALMPLARRRVKIHEFKLMNEDEKTVLRLVLEEASVSPDALRGNWQALPRTIRLLPLKGYDKYVRQTQDWLEAAFGPLHVELGFLERIYAAANLKPGGYSSKFDLALQPEMTSFDAARRILLNLLDNVEINESGVCNDIDSEFLHDFRVALRRTRSALSHLKGVFNEAQLARHREAFFWLAGTTGPTRDLDVYLLGFPGYEKLLTPEYRPGLGALRDLMARQRHEAFKSLVRVLKSKRYRGLKQDWRAFLTKAPEPDLKGPDADKPCIMLASARIWRLYRKLIHAGRAINEQSPGVELHELRKMTKKLRYMFEFFKSLYPQGDVGFILKLMKTLQQNLGDFQDHEVQVHVLKGMMTVLEKEGKATGETYLAIGMLMAHLTELQMRARHDFTQSFAKFDSGDMRKIFRKLFHCAPNAGENH